ncbi:hypothetical protein [Methylobacterium sp. JK268]
MRWFGLVALLLPVPPALASQGPGVAPGTAGPLLQALAALLALAPLLIAAGAALRRGRRTPR